MSDEAVGRPVRRGRDRQEERQAVMQYSRLPGRP